LPHERLTKKELEKMNGEVMTYNPNAWYSWEEFKKLKMEWQVNYVNSLITRYNCSCTGICRHVFGISRTALSKYFKKFGQLEFINNRDAHWRTTAAGDQKLKEDVEAARTPEEIQNGSNEEPKEPTLEEKVAEAIDTVTLYASHMPMPPDKIDEVFIEKTGMTREDAEKAIGVEWDNPGEPVEATEDSTDVQSFSIVMDHIDMSIIHYVSGLFNGKKIVVSFEVKEVL
jgi:hypothetical protein